MKKLLIIAAVLLFVVVTYVGVSGSRSNNNTTKNVPRAEDYPLLAKRLFIDDPNDTIIGFGELRKEITEYTATNNVSGSIYFEYLSTGTSIRVEGDKPEVAASLIKLPAAMELEKAAELNLISFLT